MLYSDFANPYKAVKSNALRNQWSPMALEKGGADKKKRNKDRTKDQQSYLVLIVAKGTQNASKNALEVTGASSEPVPANNAVGTIVGKSKTNSARNRSEKGGFN